VKNCPKCGKVYADETLNFCLEDGQWLREESRDEPLTAILHSTEPLGEAATRAQVVAPNETAILSSNIGDVLPKSGGLNKRLFIVPFLLAIIVLGGFFSYRYFASVNSKQIESIAVMPFVNESGTADVEYLSDGMTETLIRSLSQLPNLNVKARSSVFRYKGKETDAKTIGKELGVQAVLNGRVIQRGDQLSLNLELIDVQTENVIWTDQYDRKASDLVSLQNEIARDVSGKLRIRLSGVDQQKLAKNYTVDAEAYRLYLQGRFYWNKRTFSEVAKGVPFFKQAVERDPNFALGYVGLADSDEDRDRPVKKEYIRRALEIDDQLAEAHASLGYQYMLDYDWAASEREMRRAMELDPKYPQSYAWNGARLMMIGKYDDALGSIQHALDMEPISNGINFYKGVCLGVAGRRDEAIQQFKKIIEMDPTFPWAHSHLSRIYRLNGDFAAAAEERAISLELDGRPDLAKGTRESFARGGWNAVQEYMRQNNTTLFSVMLTEDERNHWIEQLTKQAEDGSFWLFLIKTDPIFDPLRGDPRFEALAHKFDPPQ
jgi:TolB-like protein/Tfp pilus assembly protein PilF